MTAMNRNPKNTSLLQTTKFRLTFDRLPAMTYFCQQANFPGVSMSEIPMPTPFVDLYVPGEKMVYDSLNIAFLVDEDLYAWTQVHDWIRSMTFPVEFQEYANLTRKSSQSYNKSLTLNRERPQAQYSSATLTLYTNQNNPKFRIKFVDLFPTSLSTITFNTQDSAESIATAEATFRYSYYNYERI